MHLAAGLEILAAVVDRSLDAVRNTKLVRQDGGAIQCCYPHSFLCLIRIIVLIVIIVIGVVVLRLRWIQI